MKNIILFAVITALIIACSKDETPPVINTFSLELNDTIRNTFAIDLDASDKSGVNRIELYINDTLIDEGNAIPYSYKWNTLKVNDGKHLVKLVVFDTEGNKTEKSTEVFVNNCLLMISSYNLSGPFDLVVTDEEGNVLGRQAFDVFMKRTVKSDKEFDGEAINVLMVTGSIYKSLSAWIHVKRGSEFVLGGTPVNETYKSIRLHIKNDISSFTNLRICTDHESVELKSIEDTVKIPQNFKYRPGSKMLFQLSTTAGKFYRIADLIETSAEMTINLSSITKAMEHVVITPPSPGMVTANNVCRGQKYRYL